MKAKRRGRGSAGFTLVEILVAVMIFSVIMLTLFATFRTFISSAQHVKNAASRMETVQSVFEHIRTDLQMMFITRPPRYNKPGFDADPDPYRFTGEESAFGFATVNRIRFGEDPRESVARVRYYLRENRDRRYTLHRHEGLPPYPDDEPSCSDPAVVRDIGGLEIAYIDVEGNEYTSWDSESDMFDYRYPAAVRMRILPKEEGENGMETTVTVPVNREAVE